jgi:hypothetical protein
MQQMLVCKIGRYGVLWTVLRSYTMSDQPSADTKPVSRGVRGPSYPAIGLEEAITRATQFYKYEKRSAAPVEAAANHWGYAKGSSSWKSILAALIHFGLMEEAGGSGDSRQVKLTGRTLDILLDATESPKRLAAIRDAAFSPKLYAEIFGKWPPHELPSDQSMRFYLLREKGFNESSLPGFFKDFRATIAFANLENPPTIPDIEPIGSDQKTENQGAFQPENDKEIQLNSVQTAHLSPTQAANPSNKAAMQAQVGFKQDTFSLDEGQVVLIFPEKMSDTSYEDFKDWIELQLRKIKRSIH